MNLNKQPIDSNTKQACDTIVSFFSEYQNIMFKVFTTSQNMSADINKIKKIIFDEVLVHYYEESMEFIDYITSSIHEKYIPKYFLAVPDFIDLIYQNAFYDIFSTKLQELELVEPEKIKAAHLKIFNLIVYVEHKKYKLYEDYESKAPDNLAVLNTLKKRKNNSLLRINVCVNLLENYPRNSDYDYVEIIEKNGIFKKDPNFTDKFFKEIN